MAAFFDIVWIWAFEKVCLILCLVGFSIKQQTFSKAHNIAVCKADIL